VPGGRREVANSRFFHRRRPPLAVARALPKVASTMTKLAAVGGSILAVSVAACSADRAGAGRGPERTGTADLPDQPGSQWTVVTLADFNADGMQDVLWFDTTTGRISVWLMRGTDVLETGAPIAAPAGDGWVALNAADFNFDGMADVLWGNATTNCMAVWLMHSTCLLQAGAEFSVPEGTGWVAASAGDTNGDGMADVVWQNPVTQRMAVWLMHGTQVLERGAELPIPP
jgi:hypothetical protein